MSFMQVKPIIIPCDSDAGREKPRTGNVDAAAAGDVDTIGMLMREMAKHPLLTAEEEIVLATRLQDGRMAALRGICSVPFGARALIALWRSVTDGTAKLRDIADIAVMHGAEGDDEGDGAQVSMTAMERELMPSVAAAFGDMEIFSGMLCDLQGVRMSAMSSGLAPTDADDAEVAAAVDGIVEAMSSFRLHDTLLRRICDDVSALNTRLTAAEGALLRLATGCGVDRQDFLSAYLGKELDCGWADSVATRTGKGWERFAERHADEITSLLDRIADIAVEAGIPPSELKTVCAAMRRSTRDADEARTKMINSNLRLVVSIARTKNGKGVPLADLIQEGMLGLLKAVDKFDPRRGCKFGTPATWWIRQAVSRALTDQSRTIKLPVHTIETINRFVRTARQFSQEHGREPTADELADAMDMPIEKVLRVMKVAKDPVSLDTPVGDEETGGRLGDFIEDTGAVMPFDVVVAAKMKEAAAEALDMLDAREATVLRMRYGIGMDEEYTLDGVGEVFGVTRERIRQIAGKGERKLAEKAKHLKVFVTR